MIRKDILPDVWPDAMACTAQRSELRITPAGGPVRMVMCDGEADWPIFQIHAADANSTLLADGQGCANVRIVVEEGAEAEFYRLQGVRPLGDSVNKIEVEMKAGSHLTIGTFTFGGGHVRNDIVVRMVGEGCTLDALGLYLIDREQQVDNYLFVEHQKPRCASRTLYKGIIDDAARARFNGHVLVQDGAVKTEAYQTNRNILLTDKAHVDTRPFLEIYNDDVKCSHGSTIGQLDEQAMFYLQTRGISARTAMTMLSYAFCDEVIRGIGIGSLRGVVGDVVKKRLHGELTPCDECAIPCSTPCNGEDANFIIDPSKL